ncbi:response regulator [Salinisphaera sp. T31B1]|uniref:response regulator transcription factor n=1 Tax=Salinisphaera sp. T31B1 TaxID=727963 RepID=UPI003341AF0F
MSLKVLLVEDDTAFAATLARSLTRLGHDPTTASTPEAALAAVENARFDAAVVDLRLGERSGLALIEPLLAADAELRILMLTGFASIATAIHAIKLGACNYLPKPATARQILAALDEPADTPAPEPPGQTSLRRLEWEHIQQVLAAHEYNISATARALGMHRRTLQRKLAKKPVRE